MATTTDLHYLPLSEIAAHVRGRDVSPVELTEALLERISRVDAALHSYATLTAASALAEARRAEQDLARGTVLGPLHGVPIAVKDLCDVSGVPTACGTTVMRDRVPDVDATVVARLRAAGAILVGKTQLAEGAFAEHHPDVAAPVNPWSAEHWSGVSSSGSGVAVAAGLCFAAIGTDTGGSIRFPAAVNGVVGLKPTWGRVSRHGVFPLAESMDHVGPIARTVLDAAIAFDAIAGFDPNDPTSLREPVAGCADAIGAGIEGLRVGVDRRYATEGVDPPVVAAFDEALDLLTRLGAEIRDVVVPPVEPLLAGWMPACAAEAVVAHRATYPARADEYGPALRGLLDAGLGLPAHVLAEILRARRELTGRLGGVFADVDLLAFPVLPVTTPTLTQMVEALGDPQQVAALMRFTAPYDMAGTPTLTLPCGQTPDGLPIGFQLAGPALSEALLCRAGHAYEGATPWHERRPPV